MATRNHPDARLLPSGELVSFEEGEVLPNYSGLVYASFGGRSYIMWAYPPDDGGHRRWSVINPGPVVVQAALDQFLQSPR